MILLGFLNAIAGGVLVALLLRSDGARAGERGGPADAGRASLVEPTVSPGDPGGGAAAPPGPADPGLQGRVETVIANALVEARRRSGGKVTPSNTAVAVHVADLASGASLVSIQGDTPLRPASALKVLTCVAALEAMGRDGHFETAFELSGAGDLVARAGGDPLYRADSDGALDPWLDDLAAQLRAAGVTRVAGALVLDEGTFLEPGPGPGWPSREQHWADYCGLSAGFSANAGCLTATVTPGAAGGPATTIVRPRDHGLARKGQVTTGARGSRNAVNVGANRAGVTVRGTLPAGVQPFVCRFAHPDPVELFGHAVSEGLRRRGVPVAGGIRRERGAEGGRRVALLRSPIAPLLEPILLDSENPVADQLLLAAAVRAGLSGDRAGGQALVRRALEGLDVPSDGLVLVDGSGLSRDDRVAAHHFTATMVALRGHQGWPALLAALPVAGETGSLANRMRTAPARGRVHAKTGFIGGTSALVGVTRTLDGRELAFAVLVNYPVVSGLNTSCWKPMGDELAGLLVESEDPR